MKRLACPVCAARVYFERAHCPVCATELAFVPRASTMMRASDAQALCTHRAMIACNWTTESSEPFCKACRLNRIVPNLSHVGNADRWMRIEQAKRRLVVDLMRLGLPIVTRKDDAVRGLAFDLMSNALTFTPVRTGHDNGLITLDIAEADDDVREARRTALHEPYRTLLGHVRHEIAHYYFTMLVEQGPTLPAFRAVFGDERADYGTALQTHYQNGAPTNWRDHYISAYASSHPWEDWAETFAHFLHVVATLDTAIETSLVGRDASIAEDAYREPDFDRLIAAFRPLTEAINEINRSMGVADIYPFSLPPPVVGKLHFVHLIVQQTMMRDMHAPVAAALAF